MHSLCSIGWSHTPIEHPYDVVHAEYMPKAVLYIITKNDLQPESDIAKYTQPINYVPVKHFLI